MEERRGARADGLQQLWTEPAYIAPKGHVCIASKSVSYGSQDVRSGLLHFRRQHRTKMPQATEPKPLDFASVVHKQGHSFLCVHSHDMFAASHPRASEYH